jgi:phenylacetate-coenzyme A ligase PaaK-like adenylate-forming protein
MLNPLLISEAMGRVLATERLTRESLAELQRRRWRELVKFAAQHSAFYGQLYNSINLDEAELGDLPPVSKPVIQEHFDRVVTDPRVHLADVKAFCERPEAQAVSWFLGEFVALLTSGTTGHRGYYLWDRGALAEAVAVGFRQSNRGRLGSPPAPQRIAAIIQIDGHDATNVLLSTIPPSVGTKRIIDIRDDFGEICRQLDEFQPTLLASYPYMLWLLSEAQRADQDSLPSLNIRPQRITSSADVLNDSDRHAIRKAFGVDVYNYYCSTEFPYIAWECDAHEGLHVNADTLILESVDADDRPVPPGRLGAKVLVTSLSNRVLPLIRYEMSDQVAYMSEPCSCGCVLPRIRTVAGREEHLLSLPGIEGNTVPLIEEYVDSIIGPKPEVATYQVIQDAGQRLIVNVVGRRPYAWDQIRRAVLEGFQECFARYRVAVDDVNIDVRPVEALEPVHAGTGKICRFWNRCRGLTRV